MTWITPRLNERVQILIPRLTPNDDGGGDLEFGVPFGSAFESGSFEHLAPLLTVWMSMEPVSFKGSGSKYIRGKQVNEATTHGFQVRHNSVSALGKQFALGFNIGFAFMPNLVGLKSEYFLLVQRASAVKGRLFRIHNVTDDKERREFLNVAAEEIEERGVGWPA